MSRGPLIKMILCASSDAVDTDFVAKLVDVYPDGKAYNMAEGLLRARYRESLGQVSSSEYQESSTKINVLLPDDLKRSRRYRALYVLSVDAGDGMQFGDALGEVRRLELQNRYSLSAFMLRSLKPRGMRTIR